MVTMSLYCTISEI